MRNFKGKTATRRAQSFTRIQKVGILMLGIAALVALIGYLNQHHGLYLGQFLGNLLNDYYANVSTELASIAITVLIIDYLVQKRDEDREKRDLILQMGSPDNAFATEAVRKLRARGWGFGTDRSLVRVNLQAADLEGANLETIRLEGSNLWGANLKGANLKDAKLEGTDLERAILENANLWGANLEGANLVETNLRGADLRLADLESAYLEAANLEGANLEEAHMKLAYLQLANLKGANLIGSEMKSADLIGANIESANLAGANLERARVSKEQLSTVNSLAGTRLPDGNIYAEQ